MNSIQIFENPDFGQVRVVVGENNEPLFCLVDVCRVLELSNPSQVKTRLDKEGLQLIDFHALTSNEGVIFNELGNKDTTFIDESNLYQVIFQSRKESAVIFKRWVTKEVLPSIRKTGSYSVTTKLPQTFAEALRAYADEVEKNEALKLENSQQKQIIGELQPKASYYDLILSSQDCMTVTQIAKDYGLTAQYLNSKLKDLGVQFKQSGQWLLKEKHSKFGYTKSETVPYQKQDGTMGTALHTKWTQKGRLFLYELLKKNNILPLIEQE